MPALLFELTWGEIAALLCAFSWAGTTVILRSQSGRLSAVTINVIRSATAGAVSILLLAALRPTSLTEGLPLWALGLLVLSVLTGAVLGDTLFFESLRLIGVARSMMLAGTNPLFAAVLAVLILGETVTLRMGAGILLVVFGVYLVVVRPGSGGSQAHDLRLGTVLALAAAVLWALGTVVIRPALDVVEPLAANAIRLPLSALLIGAYGWWAGRLNSRADLKPRRVAVVVLAGLIGAVSTLLYLLAVQQAGAAKTAALTSTSPLFAAPLALLIYREPLTPRLLAGLLVSVVGVVLLVGT